MPPRADPHNIAELLQWKAMREAAASSVAASSMPMGLPGYGLSLSI